MIRRTGAWIAVALALAALGCQRYAVREKGTFECSCGATGCNCGHCRGEKDECRCRAADAYGSDAVGEPRSR